MIFDFISAFGAIATIFAAIYTYKTYKSANDIKEIIPINDVLNELDRLKGKPELYCKFYVNQLISHNYTEALLKIVEHPRLIYGGIANENHPENLNIPLADELINKLQHVGNVEIRNIAIIYVEKILKFIKPKGIITLH